MFELDKYKYGQATVASGHKTLRFIPPLTTIYDEICKMLISPTKVLSAMKGEIAFKNDSNPKSNNLNALQ